MGSETAALETRDMQTLLATLKAFRKGDFTTRMPEDWTGMPGKIADALNEIIDMAADITSEFERVSQLVGKQGKVDERIQLPLMKGSWRKTVNASNSLADNLLSPMNEMIRVIDSVAEGDLRQQIPREVNGVRLQGQFLKSAEIVNTMVTRLSSFASEVTRVAWEVGTEGILGGQAKVAGVSGTWKDLTDSVNGMAANLTTQVRNIAYVTTAVANGDLSKTSTIEAKGEILELKNTINTMVGQLSSFADEVTRVALEVGTEGKLGGQARVRGVSGTWRDLTESVNGMAANLTTQVRNIAQVSTAVARGDLGKKITVEAKGEILELKNTINTMVDQLSSFAAEVTRVALEVGTDGKLGGQANVPDAAGTWRDLTDNVNGLAANLTNQVRAIADVATAVTKGDLTRSVQVEAKGEVAELKDNVNEMIRNLRETTRQNAEQVWLKTNLAKFTRLLQGQRDLAAVSRLVLSELAPLIDASHGVFYLMTEGQQEPPKLKLLSTYAYKENINVNDEWRLGEGLVGQCAYDKRRVLLTDVPSSYVAISSGLGAAAPLNVVVFPILFEGEVKAVVEMASFTPYSPIHQVFLDQLAESIGIVLNTIEANMRTEELLKQSQLLTQELQLQQEELRQTNEELEHKARLLAEQKTEVERKNREVELTKLSLEEKAEQLMLTSRYKSEFLSSMSHELRTPLNSLLILAHQFSCNSDGNLTPKQVEYAKTIHGAGKDLLELIDEILYLSKIESGTVTLDFNETLFADLRNQIERTFRPVAESRALSFTIDMAPSLPAGIWTDEKRLLQVIRNMLSNAFKFTEKGGVSISIAPATSGWSVNHSGLDRADRVLAFIVSDTGIGISADKQKLIFEAFQQADTGTSRKYGGTGLGLSISRELALRLGGELRLVSSDIDRGSTFAMYLPLRSGDADSRPPSQLVADDGDHARRADIPQPLQLVDDRESVQPGDRVLLIFQSDTRLAGLLLAAARREGFKAIVTTRGADALALVERYDPMLVSLDLDLPDMGGWSTLEQFKRNFATRHIPVQVISTDDDRARGLSCGAFSYLVKPVAADEVQQSLACLAKFAQRQERTLLVVDSNEDECNRLLDLLGGDAIRIDTAGNASEAQKRLGRKHYDCLVTHLKLADMAGSRLLDTLRSNDALHALPTVVYGAEALTRQERKQLLSSIDKRVAKEVRSPERLLDETMLFLHRPVSGLSLAQRRMLERLYEAAESLEGKKALVVDDDVRNIFALTSVLEANRMQVISAENGQTAIELLWRHADTDIVLMDIMMPGMDGFKTMEQIRSIMQFEALPMIALTAKAMKGDREKCIEAGASDYVSKPVDTARLLSLIRKWLYR
jgi:signal transduction histidine kinase/DNA-binding response OmpR family regulator/HAMP domain-containing protein